MSEDGRKIFSLETVLGVFAGQNNAAICELLTFAIKRDVCEQGAAIVAPMVKGWLMGQHPELGKLSLASAGNFAVWTNEMKKVLGDNISMPNIADEDAKGITSVLDFIDTTKQEAESAAEQAEELTTQLEASKKEVTTLAPFKEKAEKLTATIADLQEKAKAAVAEIAELKKNLTAFDGKLAIDEGDLDKAIKDIVKKAVGSMSFAGAAAGADGAAPEETTDSSSDEGDVPDTFGFGASGDDSDGFGF